MTSDPVVLGQGNANILYVVDSGLVRISKRNEKPEDVLQNWQKWKLLLGDYMGDMKLIDHSTLGKGVFMEHYGKGDRFVVEFKPKWLLQSPDAPSGSLCCRTCAIKTMRKQQIKFCPLQLAAKVNLEVIFKSLGAKDAPACAKYLSSHDLIDKLVTAQQNAPSVDTTRIQDLLEAMTIRDCTIIIETTENNDLRARLIDLDPKRVDKLAKWKELESQLQPFYKTPCSSCFLTRK